MPASARTLSLRVTAKVHVVTSSPAAGPTIVAPKILPRGLVITLIWPPVSRSACARSFSRQGQRSTRKFSPRSLAWAPLSPKGNYLVAGALTSVTFAAAAAATTGEGCAFG